MDARAWSEHEPHAPLPGQREERVLETRPRRLAQRAPAACPRRRPGPGRAARSARRAPRPPRGGASSAGPCRPSPRTPAARPRRPAGLDVEPGRRLVEEDRARVGRRTRAQPTSRRRSPPERPPACRRAISARPKRSSSSLPGAGRGKCARTRSTISRTRSVGGKPHSCGVTPIAGARGGLRGSRPKSSARPESGRRSPSRSERAVVLPAPFGPSSASTSPCLELEVDGVERDRLAEALRHAHGARRRSRRGSRLAVDAQVDEHVVDACASDRRGQPGAEERRAEPGAGERGGRRTAGRVAAGARRRTRRSSRRARPTRPSHAASAASATAAPDELLEGRDAASHAARAIARGAERRTATPARPRNRPAPTAGPMSTDAGSRARAKRGQADGERGRERGRPEEQPAPDEVTRHAGTPDRDRVERRLVDAVETEELVGRGGRRSRRAARPRARGRSRRAGRSGPTWPASSSAKR